METTIKLDKRHLDQIVEVDYHCNHPVEAQRNLSKKDVKKYTLKRMNKKEELFYGHKIGQEIVGYVTLKPFFPGYKHCEVYWLAVKENYQKHGIGKKLMRFIEKVAKDKGFRKVCLYTGEDMVNAQKFYERIGYKKINKFPGYHDFANSNNTAILYAKEV
jgi:ribosomal protein S18 acetylase RimI-like enzyme